MKMRRLTRGVEIGNLRFFWTKKNWKAKAHPYWFHARYPGGTWTFQSMRFEVWRREH